MHYYLVSIYLYSTFRYVKISYTYPGGRQMDWGIPELNNASNGIIIKTLWCVAIVCDEEVYDC